MSKEAKLTSTDTLSALTKRAVELAKIRQQELLTEEELLQVQGGVLSSNLTTSIKTIGHTEGMVPVREKELF
jgi:hypothetical protein